EDHVAAACRAILACRRAEAALNLQRAQRQRAPLRTRFGLNTGVAVIGNVGSRSRMQYTSLGQMVNLAARIEGLNKSFNTQALVSAKVEQTVRGRFLFRPLGPMLAVGTRVPVTLFELLDDTDEENHALTEAWAAPFNAWQNRRWAMAEAELTEFLNTFPRDGAAHLLLGHCRAFLHTPPAADWDGVLRFDVK
ncbi:MAG: adenylate/guanylate cyclase domain-containing protein, partial [Rhodospirillaceae bacterium]|nr:adenylate/guanylate cyclase domain-containing protein [Rhodospirillales bacterium]